MLCDRAWQESRRGDCPSSHTFPGATSMSSHEPPEILQLTARAKEGAQLTVSPLAGQTDLICIVCNGFCG